MFEKTQQSRKEKCKSENINLWLKFHKGKCRYAIMKSWVVVDNEMSANGHVVSLITVSISVCVAWSTDTQLQTHCREQVEFCVKN